MKLGRLTKGIGVLFAITLIVSLFTYEFSVPSRFEAGVGLSLIPRFGTQILGELPSRGIWFTSGDEWGGAPLYLRNVISRDVLVASTALLTVSLALERWPVGGCWVFRSAVVVVAGFLGLRFFTLGQANWEANEFAIAPALWPDSTGEIVDARWNEHATAMVVSREVFECREWLLSWTTAACLFGVGLALLAISPTCETHTREKC